MMLNKVLFLLVLWIVPLFSYPIRLNFESRPCVNYLPQQEQFLAYPKIGLVLSGGGVRGLCQIGVIRVLEENRIPISYITGTSIGALIGGLYATGLSADSIQRVAVIGVMDWKELFFTDSRENKYYYYQRNLANKHIVSFRFKGWNIQKMQGFSYGQNLLNLIFRHTLQNNVAAGLDFNRLMIPFRCVATDLIKGQSIIFDRGFLSDAIFASVSVPSVIFPYTIDSAYCVDGGILDNIPVDVMKQFQPDMIITVDNSSPLRDEKNLNTIFDIFDQITTIAALDKNQQQRDSSDILIVPDLGTISSSDFNQIDSIIQLGYLAGTKKITQIRTMYQDFRLKNIPDTSFFITEIVCQDSLLRSQLPFMMIPGRLTHRELYLMLEHIYQSTLFQNLWIDIRQENSKTIAEFFCKKSLYIKTISCEYKPEKWPSGDLYSILFHYENRNYSPIVIDSLIRHVNQFFFDLGYALYFVDEYHFEPADSALFLRIHAGRIDSISFKGNSVVNSNFLSKKTSFKKGDNFNYLELNQSVDRIYNTGLFNRVSYQIIPEQNELYHIVIQTEEKPMGIIRMGYQYNNYERLLGYFQVGYDYTSLLADAAYLTTVVGKRNSISLTFQADELLATNLGYRIHLDITDQPRYWYRPDQPRTSYRQQKHTYSFSISGNYLKRIGVSMLSFDYIKADNYRATDYPDHRANYYYSYWSIGNIIDSRDHLLFPTQGILFYWNVLFSDHYIFQNKRFIQAEMNNQINLTLIPSLVYQLNLEIGFSKNDLPYELQFPINEKHYFPVYGKDERFSSGKFLVSHQFRWCLTEFQNDILRRELYGVVGMSGMTSIDSFKDVLNLKKDKQFCGFVGLIQNTIIGQLLLMAAFDNEKNNTVYFFMGTHF